jgi:hypothetical protein
MERGDAHHQQAAVARRPDRVGRADLERDQGLVLGERRERVDDPQQGQRDGRDQLHAVDPGRSSGINCRAWSRRIGSPLAAVFVVALTIPAPRALATAVVPAAGRAGSDVIVVLRNQHHDLGMGRGHLASARRNAFHLDEDRVITKAHADGAKNLRGFDTVNAVAATVTSDQAAELATDPLIAAVYPDLPIKATPMVSDRDSDRDAASSSDAQPHPVSTGICPSDPGKPMLEPEALQTTHTAFADPSTPQAQNIVDGTGVKVAFIADGLDVDNPDFIRADGSHVFVDYQDFSEDGPNAPTDAREAFGDASSIAAQGRETYDLAHVVNPAHPLPAGCTIRILGVAPGASLIALKVFSNRGIAPTSSFIQAIDYAVGSGADVLNESFGSNPYPDTGNDPISLADGSAVAAGLTVVVSSGDAGVTGTVGSPASTPNGVIAVAATTTMQTNLQETFGGAQLSNGTWIDENIAAFSSGGITQSGRTPDLAAPGDSGWAVCAADAELYLGCQDFQGNPSPIQDFGGTSQSAPLTAGAAALVIEAYKLTHHGQRPSPAVVKQILTGTATDLGHPAYQQGAGELNSLKAVQAAQSWQDGNGRPAPTGSALVVDRTQLFSAGEPNSPVANTLTVTNVGGRPQQVVAAVRTLGRTVSDRSGTVPLDTTSPSTPTFLDIAGQVRSYATLRFTVGKGVDHLTVWAAAAALAAPQLTTTARVTLIDPSGVLAAFSEPQGLSNLNRGEVRYPAPGVWTAYFFLAQISGFNGPVSWRVLQQNFVADGVVTPSTFTLAPGASRRVTVSTREPSSPGDVSASVQLVGSVSGATSTPLSLRADVPPRDYSFSGTITGGNGRGYVDQSQVYYLDVPRGRRDLGVGVTLGDPGDTVLATLTSPEGQSYSYNSNVAPDLSETGPGIQDFVDNPEAGRWILTIQVLDPVSGTVTHSPYQVVVRYDSVSARAPGLPISTRTTLTAGKPMTIPVTITADSAKALSYFVDARLDQLGTVSLAQLDGDSSTTFALPAPYEAYPLWLVPTHVSKLSVTATATLPVNVGLYWQSGNPYGYALGSDTTAMATMSGSPLTPGLWTADVAQNGPFAGPAPTGQVTVAGSAVGQLFDPTVTSSTGDFWTTGVEGQSSAANEDLAVVTKRLLAQHTGSSDLGYPSIHTAGTTTPQSTTVMVTITPSGSRGTQVHGHLYLGSYDAWTFDADELIDLPYAYTVG